MHRIIAATTLAPEVRKLVIEAPHVLRHCGPGQFVIVRATADGERIPLTIAQADRDAGTVTLIVQAVGASTKKICSLEAGDAVADLAGPMGHKTEIRDFGHAVIVGGGVGTAVILPQARALKECGNRVTAVIGGRSRPYVILEEELAEWCDAAYPCTDDGSYGFHGFVTQKLAEVIQTGPIGFVLTAGPVPMMRAVAEVTRPAAIPTVASLNPIMVDGTGMCGGCRVQVGGEVKFACVDGPEFDAHQVNFADLTDRLTAYRSFEVAAMRGCQ